MTRAFAEWTGKCPECGLPELLHGESCKDDDEQERVLDPSTTQQDGGR